MKKSNLKLSILSLFTFVAFSLFLTSCDKEVDFQTVETVKELPANNPDVEEYVRVQSSFVDKYVTTSSQTQINGFITAVQSADYSTENAFRYLNLSVEEAKIYAEKLNSVKENLQEKHPSLKLQEVSMNEFHQEMYTFLPSNNSSKRNPLDDCLQDVQARVIGLYIGCWFEYGNPQNPNAPNANLAQCVDIVDFLGNLWRNDCERQFGLR